jgi:N-acetylglucosamine malate deacetylase 1
VGILDLTGGESGTHGSAALRAEEAEAAARVLGVSARHNARLPDAGITNDGESRRRVVEWIRAFRPRVVILPFPRGRHPDHRVGSQLCYDACFLAGLRNYAAEGEAHRPHKVVYASAFREDAGAPSFVVDITAEMETKLEAVACFASQFEGKSAAGEVYPGGERPLLEQVRFQAAHYGSLIRAPYGEPYLVAETMAVSDITGLEVSTF